MSYETRWKTFTIGVLKLSNVRLIQGRVQEIKASRVCSIKTCWLPVNLYDSATLKIFVDLNVCGHDEFWLTVVKFQKPWVPECPDRPLKVQVSGSSNSYHIKGLSLVVSILTFYCTTCFEAGSILLVVKSCWNEGQIVV